MDYYDIDWSTAEQGPETPDDGDLTQCECVTGCNEDDYDDDAALERRQQRQEQRFLGNDANWELP